jgi:hypothetical protein
LIPKDLEKIQEQDLQELVSNSVLEHKTLEYKLTLPGNTNSEKKEFLADISSFANAAGGDLVYGVLQDSETGFPKELRGLDVQNIDQEILRLDSMIRSGINPRIPTIRTQPISLSNSKTVVIVRVQKSWISPHRVTLQDHDKFYSRSTNGKYALDVTELRIAFNLSGTSAERIRSFRQDRISRIFANETPVPFKEGAKIILHLIPITAFDPSQQLDVQEIASHQQKLMPMIWSSGKYRYNLDGFLTYSAGNSARTHSYVQMFRNGIIEAVEGTLLEEDQIIPASSYEEELIKSVPGYLSVLKALNVALPVFISLTLVGVEGYSMGVDRFRRFESTPIDREVLILPEVMIETYECKIDEVLRPIFDSIWNACGYPKSLNYDKEGKWHPYGRA